MSILPKLCTLIAAAVLASAPADGHHGPVDHDLLYDVSELVELQGQLVDVFWRNPHVRAKLEVTTDNGDTEVWQLIMGPAPRRFHNMGISAEDFDGKVRVAGHVARHRQQALGVLHILLADGREYVQQTPRNNSRTPLWSGAVLAHMPDRLDPDMVEADKRTANGLFRKWNVPVSTGPGDPLRAALRAAAYTDLGKQLSDAYDPLADNPLLRCKHGMPEAMYDPRPIKLEDHGSYIHLEAVQFNVERRIYMGVEMPTGVEASNVGYSAGRWEGDVLVVETAHIDWPYYSPNGTPQSLDTRYHERFWMSGTEDEPVLNYTLTISDPQTFEQPVEVVRTTRKPIPGYEFPPYNCAAEWDDEEE